MISFVLVLVSLKTVALAALAGMLVGWVLHFVHHRFCKHDHGCCSTKQACAPGQKCEQGYPSVEKHDECCANCNFGCLAVYKLIAYGLTFVQAYGIAFLLERFELLADYQDAILLTLFIAVTFWLAKKVACTMWHRKSWSHLFCKVVGRFIVLATIAAVIVYLA